MSTCGDGVKASNEGCDDDDTDPEDGCDASCQVETGWSCSETADLSICTTPCGDGNVLGTEECDSVAGCTNCAADTGFACLSNVCTSTCGDGIKASDEGCDDNDTDPGDGCDNLC